METRQWEVVQLELKYCERCGGLWLRRRGADVVCCASCLAESPEFRILHKSRRRPTLPVNHNGQPHPQLKLVPKAGGQGGKA